MVKIRKFNSFKECFGRQSPFKSELLGFLIVEYSFFGDINDVDENIYECMELIGLNSNSEFELYVSSGGYGSTEKIRNYYALWKSLKRDFDVSKFNIIHECKIKIDEKIRYAGVAQFKTNELCEAIKIVSEYKFNSFIYATSERKKYSEEKIYSFFENACISSNELNQYTIINYDYLYSKMRVNDVVINVGYDGEEIAVYFIKKDH